MPPQRKAMEGHIKIRGLAVTEKGEYHFLIGTIGTVHLARDDPNIIKQIIKENCSPSPCIMHQHINLDYRNMVAMATVR